MGKQPTGLKIEKNKELAEQIRVLRQLGFPIYDIEKLVNHKVTYPTIYWYCRNKMITPV
jgi:DNA-binding transcriptional MerR regulator